jgi:hypothetical protein
MASTFSTAGNGSGIQAGNLLDIQSIHIHNYEVLHLCISLVFFHYMISQTP